jgi:hypothetical protein
MLAALFGGAVLLAPVHARDDTSADMGTPASGATVRVVTIEAATQFIKTRQFETLTIRNRKGQSFAWRFDTPYAPTAFPLKHIAPPEFEAGDTWVYVGPKAR